MSKATRLLTNYQIGVPPDALVLESNHDTEMLDRGPYGPICQRANNQFSS